ncbi:hypothetical protein C7212DRAFT_308827, partial [Tuber magnatum]
MRDLSAPHSAAQMLTHDELGTMLRALSHCDGGGGAHRHDTGINTQAAPTLGPHAEITNTVRY